MKLILTILTMLLTQTSFADGSSICRYLAKNSFNSVSKKLIEDPSPKLTTLISRVSLTLQKKAVSQCRIGKFDAAYDFDSCSSSCLSFGSSTARLNIAIRTNGIIDLNKETRDCQKLCKAYQLISFAYMDGSKGKTTDCNGVVSNSDRGNSKSELMMKIKKTNSSRTIPR